MTLSAILSAELAAREYALAVARERVAPLLIDGLLPVHRSILWAMVNLGLTATGKPVKSARIVGDVIGKFHPHGDDPAYSAMVKLGQQCIPLIDPTISNMGTVLGDAEAAARYTETRPTAWASILLLDKDRLKAVDYEPNYDDSEKMPVFFPALLPMALINRVQGIGLGTRSHFATYSIESVAHCVCKVWSGKKVTPDDLEESFMLPTIVEQSPTASMFYTGVGTGKYQPVLEVVNSRLIIIRGLPPLVGLKQVDSLIEIPGVKSVIDFCQRKEDQGAQAKVYNIEFHVETRCEAYDVVAQVRQKLSKTLPYGQLLRIGGRIARLSIKDYLTLWCRWRTDFEVKYQSMVMAGLEAKLRQNELLRLILGNPDQFVEAVRQPDPDFAVAALYQGAGLTQDEIAWMVGQRFKVLTNKSVEQLDLADAQWRKSHAEAKAIAEEPIPFLVDTVRSLF